MSVTFIEASAGTGKTYTLVRHVLELVARGVRAESILLVTFTEKATDELKDRIRRGLRGEYLATRDERVAQVLEDWSSLTITTIHGFCRLLLTQYPLESGVSFEPEMVDQTERGRRLLRDEVRSRLTSLGTLLEWAALENEDDLLALAGRALHDGVFDRPLLHPDENESALFDRLRFELEAGTGRLWEAVRGLPKGLPSEAGTLPDADLLNASTSRVPYRLANELAAAASWRELIDVLGGSDVAAYLEKWEAAVWKKAAVPPVSGRLADLRIAALNVADTLRDLQTQTGVEPAAFLRRCARYRLFELLVKPALERRSDRELTFRDLIERVRSLARGGALDTAAGRWQAVLIDEFQDTDQDQWEIFSRLFLRDGCELTVVGDPKQSIYRFRGADLDVYRAARAQVGSNARFEVLDRNYRSTASMIEAVNALFDPARTPWPRPDDFRPSLKGDRPVATLRTREGVEFPPIVTQTADDENDWHRHLVATTLTLFEHVLDDGVSAPAPVTPADILVLVRRNREADTVAQLLSSKGIPVAVGGSGGLLATREAQEAVLFLKALESPGSLSAAKALGWTRLLAGADAETLAPALQAAQQDRFRGAFLGAFRRVAAALDRAVDGGGLETLLRQPGGPRLVTNTEQVLEFLQERFHRGDVPHGQAALCLERWIDSSRQEDEITLRREGDHAVVRVMTIHAAKGLESPIVLHGWAAKPRRKEPDWIVVGGVDFLLTDEGRAAEAANEAAEALRLRYVAQTRAKSYQVICDDEGAKLPAWTAETWNAVARWTPPETARGPMLGPAVRGLEGRHPWVESHSGLWRRSQGDEETGTAWDRPRLERDVERSDPDLADQLPAGPAFGDLVHDILEAADWRGWAADADAALQTATFAVVEEHVQRHRSRLPMPGLARTLHRWLGRVLSHPLALGDAEPVSFTALDPEATRRELEFHLPFSHSERLGFVWGGREFVVHPGYLTGRIDVLFAWRGRLYLADWKTNRLAGQSPEQVMAEAGYDLQAQWYWEALTRLCRVQQEPLVPGGVLYVFLRGAGDQPLGVFLPPEVLASQRLLKPFLTEAAHG